MDTLAHGLWGGAVFGQKNREWKWAFVLGMAPDLLSFGPFFLTRFASLATQWMNRTFEPPNPHTIPAYVYHAYNVTHSLVIWTILFGVVWACRRRIYWPLAAWALHILCDIPTHSTRFFPTPFLWPLPTPFVDGTPWARSSFMLINYALIFTTYLTLRLARKRS